MVIVQSECRIFRVLLFLHATGIVPPSEDTGRKTNFIILENSDLKPKKWVWPVFVIVQPCDLYCPIRFDGEEQEDLSGCGVYLDPKYGVLWSYSEQGNRMACFNPIATNIEGMSMLLLQPQKFRLHL